MSFELKYRSRYSRISRKNELEFKYIGQQRNCRKVSLEP